VLAVLDEHAQKLRGRAVEEFRPLVVEEGVERAALTEESQAPARLADQARVGGDARRDDAVQREAAKLGQPVRVHPVIVAQARAAAPRRGDWTLLYLEAPGSTERSHAAAPSAA
jgi:hypothetical protein